MLDVFLKQSHPPSFLNKFVEIDYPNLSSYSLWVVDGREASDGWGCWCSALDVAVEAFSLCEGPPSVFWSFSSDWVLFQFSYCPYLVSKFWFLLTRKVRVEISG